MQSTTPPLLRRLLLDYSQSGSLGFRFRARRAVALRQLILNIAPMAADGGRRILDIGGVPAYWRIVGLDWLRTVGARVTLLNLHRIAIPPGDRDVLEARIGDGCALGDLADQSVDLAHSNSVIEHVSSPERMADFAREIRRVGRAYYVQTPNFWFPIEPHYMAPLAHWLPARWREEIVWRGIIKVHARPSDRSQAARIVKEQDLLTPRRMRHLFPEAEHRVERFWGLAKSLIAMHAPRVGDDGSHFTGEGN